MPFQVKGVALEALRDHRPLGGLSGKPLVPEPLHDLWRNLPMHEFYHAGGGNCPGVRESVLQCADAEEMVSVTMSNVDRRQVLFAGHDPISQGGSLLDGRRCIVQYSVAFAIDEGGR